MLSAEVELFMILIVLPFGTSQDSEDLPLPGSQTYSDTFPIMQSSATRTSSLGLLLLALTVGVSGSVYLCVLRYICVGCCQPVAVGPESDSISGVV